MKKQIWTDCEEYLYCKLFNFWGILPVTLGCVTYNWIG